MRLPVLVVALWASLTVGLVVWITYDEAAGLACGLFTFFAALSIFPSGRQALIWIIDKLSRAI